MQLLTDELRKAGFNVDQVIPDGRFHRFRISFDDAKNSGYYIAFQNFSNKDSEPYYVMLYGNHQDGSRAEYYSRSQITLDKFEKTRINEQIKKAQKDRERETLKLAKEAATLASSRFFSLSEEFGSNSYLQSKGITQLYGARLDGEVLCIPMRDINGDIKNIEQIYPPDGKIKKGLYGGARIGLFHQIGIVRDVVYIAEGFSTGVAIHLAMNEAVFVSFNAGNLPHVARNICVKYPNSRVVICGDNDQFKDKNVGLEKAEEAAKAVGGKFVVPTFQDITTKPTDFHDLFTIEGINAVHTQINAIEPYAIVETLDPIYVINAPYPDMTMKGAPKGTPENVEELLRRLGVIVRYNVITKEEEILPPNGSYTSDNKANVTFGYVIGWCVRVGIPIENLKTYITMLADKNLYNPVATWIGSKEWDGESRLQDLYDTIASTNEPMKEKLMRRWLVSAVAAIYEPNGVSTGGVLVLHGSQYVGKTKWFKQLVPDYLKVRADGVTFRPDDKDSVFQVISKWLVELGELDATFRKSDISQLKAFLTKEDDTIRRPYAYRESNYGRRTVFVASVNELEFLKDTTGNRRYWTISCEKIDYNHHVDMQQLWAEVKTLYDAGEDWRLDEQTLKELNEHNENFEQVDPIHERIRTYFQNTTVSSTYMTATQVCMTIGINNPSMTDKHKAGAILRKLFGEKKRMHSGDFFLVKNL